MYIERDFVSFRIHFWPQEISSENLVLNNNTFSSNWVNFKRYSHLTANQSLLNVKKEMHDVTIFDDIFFSFHS